jgi:FkbM family methyltransferase
MKRRAEILSRIGMLVGKPPGYERLMRRLMPMEKCAKLPEICLVRDGSLFITRPGLPLGWHVAFFGSYEPELRAIMRAVLPVGGTAIDAGANVGWHTLLMARLVGPSGRVLAVEANPSICEQLARNVGINRLTHIDVIACALAESDRTLAFSAVSADDPVSASGHVLSDATGETPSIQIAARRLDAIVSETPIQRLDLIKIDVEGFEWAALRGAEQTIAKFRPHILFEFDAGYAGRGGGNATVISEFFGRHNYRLFSVRRQWTEAVTLSDWPACANILAMPAGSRTV